MATCRETALRGVGTSLTAPEEELSVCPIIFIASRLRMRALAKEDLATPTHYVMCYINPKLTRKSTAFCESKTEEMADFKGGRLLAVIGDEVSSTAAKDIPQANAMIMI